MKSFPQKMGKHSNEMERPYEGNRKKTRPKMRYMVDKMSHRETHETRGRNTLTLGLLWN